MPYNPFDDIQKSTNEAFKQSIDLIAKLRKEIELKDKLIKNQEEMIELLKAQSQIKKLPSNIIKTVAGREFDESKLVHIVNRRDNSNYMYYKIYPDLYIEHHLNIYREVSKYIVIDTILEHRNGRDMLAKFFPEEKI